MNVKTICLKLSGLALLAALAFAFTAPASAQTDKGPTGITVTGHGEVMGTPDIAYVTLGIVTRDKNASQAAAENARIAQAISSAVKRVGIADKDIKTQNYSIQPWMEYAPNVAPRQLGYEVRNSVRITVRDVSKVGDVIDAGVRSGANEVQGVTFDIANDQPIRQEALAAAVQNARSKAEVVAKNLGVKVGVPLQVTESTTRVPIPLYRAAGAEAAAPTPISPGQMQITSDVTVTFSIIP